MDKKNLTLLEQDLIRLKRRKIFNIGKNAFLFSFFGILSPIASKALGLGYPFLIDTKEGYQVSIKNIDNLGNISSKNKDINIDDLKDYEDILNKLYVYNYKGEHTREVSVYEVDSEIDNYKTVINNYQDYISEHNLLDNYQEYISNNLYDLKNIKVSFECCDITRDKSNDQIENIYLNMFVTIGYLILVIEGLYICSYSISNTLEETNQEIDYIKNKIKTKKRTKRDT